MCGIAGVLADRPSDELARQVAAMSLAIAHRGPDGEGAWATDGFAFGMRRLAVVDVAGGTQPMWTASGVGLVYNGEIYNHRRLRRTLEAQGVRFRTTCDTEVVLAMYERYGLDGLDQLEGMYAIAIHDPARRAVFLARDPAGIKPLYVAEDAGGVRFASEIKALVDGPGRRPELDPQALWHYLTLRYVPAPWTIWQGIRKVEPGEVLRLDLDTRATSTERTRRYRFDSAPDGDDRAGVAQFLELFRGAVQDQLTSADVPVGITLSGGLDSSAIAVTARELGFPGLHTFSVGYEGPESELRYARLVAEHVDSVHHEVVIGPHDLVALLGEVVEATDEPLADLAAMPLLAVSRLAREHVTCALSGEGADELLGGYNLEVLAAQLHQARLVDRLGVPRPALRAAGAVLPGKLGRAARDLGAAGWSGLLAHRRASLSDVWSETDKRRLWPDAPSPSSTPELVGRWYADCTSDHPLDQFQEVATRQWLVEDLLMKADKVSMRTSLELRVPFLQESVASWAMTAPMALKVGRPGAWSSKRVLRLAMADRLPAEVLDRPKMGFAVPAHRWLRDELAPWARERLTGAGCALPDGFDGTVVAATLDAAIAGDEGAAQRTWALLVLDAWMSRWG